MTGMTPLQQLIRIRAPIAFRLTLPSLVNEAILILKASSLISVVGVIELTRMAQNLDSSLYQPIPLYAAAGLLYFIINRIIATAGGMAERRFTWGRV
jgi:polar amino acid transport system permease protein